jgi:hypothetical protein
LSKDSRGASLEGSSKLAKDAYKHSSASNEEEATKYNNFLSEKKQITGMTNNKSMSKVDQSNLSRDSLNTSDLVNRSKTSNIKEKANATNLPNNLHNKLPINPDSKDSETEDRPKRTAQEEKRLLKKSEETKAIKDKETSINKPEKTTPSLLNNPENKQEIRKELLKKKELLQNFIRTNNFKAKQKASLSNQYNSSSNSQVLPEQKILSAEEKMELMEKLVKNKEDEIIKDVQKEVIKKGKIANEKIQRKLKYLSEKNMLENINLEEMAAENNNEEINENEEHVEDNNIIKGTLPRKTPSKIYTSPGLSNTNYLSSGSSHNRSRSSPMEGEKKVNKPKVNTLEYLASILNERRLGEPREEQNEEDNEEPREEENEVENQITEEQQKTQISYKNHDGANSFRKSHSEEKSKFSSDENLNPYEFAFTHKTNKRDSQEIQEFIKRKRSEEREKAKKLEIETNEKNFKKLIELSKVHESSVKEFTRKSQSQEKEKAKNKTTGISSKNKFRSNSHQTKVRNEMFIGRAHTKKSLDESSVIDPDEYYLSALESKMILSPTYNSVNNNSNKHSRRPTYGNKDDFKETIGNNPSLYNSNTANNFNNTATATGNNFANNKEKETYNNLAEYASVSKLSNFTKNSKKNFNENLENNINEENEIDIRLDDKTVFKSQTKEEFLKFIEQKEKEMTIRSLDSNDLLSVKSRPGENNTYINTGGFNNTASGGTMPQGSSERNEKAIKEDINDANEASLSVDISKSLSKEKHTNIKGSNAIAPSSNKESNKSLSKVKENKIENYINKEEENIEAEEEENEYNNIDDSNNEDLIAVENKLNINSLNEKKKRVVKAEEIEEFAFLITQANRKNVFSLLLENAQIQMLLQHYDYSFKYLEELDQVILSRNVFHAFTVLKQNLIEKQYYDVFNVFTLAAKRHALAKIFQFSQIVAAYEQEQAEDYDRYINCLTLFAKRDAFNTLKEYARDQEFKEYDSDEEKLIELYNTGFNMFSNPWKRFAFYKIATFAFNLLQGSEVSGSEEIKSVKSVILHQDGNSNVWYDKEEDEEEIIRHSKTAFNRESEDVHVSNISNLEINNQENENDNMSLKESYNKSEQKSNNQSINMSINKSVNNSVNISENISENKSLSQLKESIKNRMNKSNKTTPIISSRNSNKENSRNEFNNNSNNTSAVRENNISNINENINNSNSNNSFNNASMSYDNMSMNNLSNYKNHTYMYESLSDNSSIAVYPNSLDSPKLHRLHYLIQRQKMEKSSREESNNNNSNYGNESNRYNNEYSNREESMKNSIRDYESRKNSMQISRKNSDFSNRESREISQVDVFNNEEEKEEKGENNISNNVSNNVSNNISNNVSMNSRGDMSNNKPINLKPSTSSSARKEKDSNSLIISNNNSRISLSNNVSANKSLNNSKRILDEIENVYKEEKSISIDIEIENDKSKSLTNNKSLSGTEEKSNKNNKNNFSNIPVNIDKSNISINKEENSVSQIEEEIYSYNDIQSANKMRTSTDLDISADRDNNSDIDWIHTISNSKSSGSFRDNMVKGSNSNFVLDPEASNRSLSNPNVNGNNILNNLNEIKEGEAHEENSNPDRNNTEEYLSKKDKSNTRNNKSAISGASASINVSASNNEYGDFEDVLDVEKEDNELDKENILDIITDEKEKEAEVNNEEDNEEEFRDNIEDAIITRSKSIPRPAIETSEPDDKEDASSNVAPIVPVNKTEDATSATNPALISIKSRNEKKKADEKEKQDKPSHRTEKDSNNFSIEHIEAAQEDEKEKKEEEESEAFNKDIFINDSNFGSIESDPAIVKKTLNTNTTNTNQIAKIGANLSPINIHESEINLEDNKVTIESVDIILKPSNIPNNKDTLDSNDDSAGIFTKNSQNDLKAYTLLDTDKDKSDKDKDNKTIIEEKLLDEKSENTNTHNISESKDRSISIHQSVSVNKRYDNLLDDVISARRTERSEKSAFTANMIPQFEDKLQMADLEYLSEELANLILEDLLQGEIKDDLMNLVPRKSLKNFSEKNEENNLGNNTNISISISTYSNSSNSSSNSIFMKTIVDQKKEKSLNLYNEKIAPKLIKKIEEEIEENYQSILTNLTVPLGHNNTEIIQSLITRDQAVMKRNYKILPKDVEVKANNLIDKKKVLFEFEQVNKNIREDDNITSDNYYDNTLNECMVDAAVELLNKERVYGELGEPLPWSNRTRNVMYKYGNSQIGRSNMKKNIARELGEVIGNKMGLISDNHEYLDIDQLNQEREKRLMNNIIKEVGNSVKFYYF